MKKGASEAISFYISMKTYKPSKLSSGLSYSSSVRRVPTGRRRLWFSTTSHNMCLLAGFINLLRPPFFLSAISYLTHCLSLISLDQCIPHESKIIRPMFPHYVCKISQLSFPDFVYDFSFCCHSLYTSLLLTLSVHGIATILL